MSERGSGWRGCWWVAVSIDTALATYGHLAQTTGSIRYPAEEAGRVRDQHQHVAAEYTNLGKSLRAESPVMRE